MLKTVLVVAVAFTVALAVGCSGTGGGGMMKCDGCKMEMSKDKICQQDGMCMKCDKGCAMSMKCKGCSMEMPKDKMCGKCGACMKCDKCPK